MIVYIYIKYSSFTFCFRCVVVSAMKVILDELRKKQR